VLQARPQSPAALLERFDANATAADAGICVGATFNRRDAFPEGSDDDKKMADLGAYWTMQVTDRAEDPGQALNYMMSAGRLLEGIEDVSPEARVTDEILRRCAAAKEGRSDG
jgi:hypothetical protein